jgi:hypothetical protein
MRKLLLASLLALLVLPSVVSAADVEISGFAGYTYPFYSHSFTYEPGPISVPISGVNVQQNGAFDLKGKGGPSLGGSIALFPVEAVGVELRLDSADLKVEARNASYAFNVTLPEGLPPISQTIDLAQGSADLRAAHPFSLNLKLRTPGRSHMFASGGISRLGDLELAVRQKVSLGITTVIAEPSSVEVSTIDLRATRPVATAGSSWGANAGLGFQVALGEHGGLVLEGRGFVFPKQTAEWEGIIDTPLSALEQELLRRLIGNVEPVEFRPWWVQATIGISYRF